MFIIVIIFMFIDMFDDKYILTCEQILMKDQGKTVKGTNPI